MNVRGPFFLIVVCSVVATSFSPWGNSLTMAGPPDAQMVLIPCFMSALGQQGSQTVARTPAVERDPDTTAASKAYLLVCPEAGDFKGPPTGTHWTVFREQARQKSRELIKVVARPKVDETLFIDAAGLRLYVSSAECRARLTSLPAKSTPGLTLDYLVRSLLGQRYAETGIEPDAIPVRGKKGRELGTQGMVFLRGGEYVRSGHYYTSQYAELGERHGEKYRVRVSSFYIDKYKVTNQQYCEFLNDGNPGYWNRAPWNRAVTRDRDGRFIVSNPKEADLPAIAVNWYQAAGYARWAGKRLPTEAEWEYAAAGSAARTYPWGNEAPDETRGNFVDADYAPGDAFPAGATPEGVFDLVGNAAEWAADFYDADYYEKSPPGGLLIDPRGPAEGNLRFKYRRMFKGFCRAPNQPEFLTCTKRHSRPPLLTAAIGFRCVKSAEEPSP